MGERCDGAAPAVAGGWLAAAFAAEKDDGNDSSSHRERGVSNVGNTIEGAILAKMREMMVVEVQSSSRDKNRQNQKRDVRHKDRHQSGEQIRRDQEKVVSNDQRERDRIQRGAVKRH